ncbi:hypothetical protein [Pseudobacteriovorax antillogorgiicola]|uniref:Uncharacterized protein n=1 Tax=Pseudobacteriovorax antillogorgiicola TaxID=1513793 RepID=A0A1Y6CJZ0_9BACT|nr:hypothetical protein [Pseudobacteriovorax antillogorgiicola]TCS48008.1 hypothetical protein EDD56_119119 [Pseudobacteriovorax antillogorgiicola]SMF58542.1 hypothetical protein SAMN06296036_119120 [Pseudobacteriovorax antillogorgiicola]
MMVRLLTFLLCLLINGSLMAEDRLLTVQMQAYQLEASSTAFHVLGPELEGWGQFGLVYGVRLYSDDNQEAVEGARDLGIVWYVREPIQTWAGKAVVLSSDIKYGQTSYHRTFVPDGSATSHDYSEITLLWGVEFTEPNSWLARYNLAVGTGWRINWLGQSFSKNLTDRSIPADRIYPLLQMGFTL